MAGTATGGKTFTGNKVKQTNAVADLLGVHEDLGVVVEQIADLPVQRGEIRIEVLRVERTMPVRHLEFFVVVQVVRGSDDREDAREAVLPQPDDLLLAADAAVAAKHPPPTPFRSLGEQVRRRFPSIR